MYKNSKKPSTTQFQKDLEWGTFFEFESISVIEGFFNKFLSTQNKRLEFLQENISTSVKELKKWDTKYIVVDNFTNKRTNAITFEIKTDKYDETGNLFFEKSCNKKLSGVFATEADYFIYCLPRYKSQNFYLVKPQKLIDLINEKFAQCLSYGGGDGGRVTSFLINKHQFDEEFVKIGKLIDWDVEIPSKFNLDRFEEKKKYTYYSNTNTLNQYENPLQ